MMPPADRWARGCGSGDVGHSGAINEYRSGVLQGNWVENGAKAAVQGTPLANNLAHSAPTGPLSTTQRRSYNEMGKTGLDLMEASQRHDDGASGVKGELLTRHGRFDQPPVQCLTTTYQLTHGRVDGTDRRPNAYVWHGRKQMDYFVPTTVPSDDSLRRTATKRQEWGSQHEGFDPYATTQKAATQVAALAVAENPLRTGTLRPPGDDGLPAHPGSRPKGPAHEELDKVYRRTGLRTNYRK